MTKMDVQLAAATDRPVRRPPGPERAGLAIEPPRYSVDFVDRRSGLGAGLSAPGAPAPAAAAAASPDPAQRVSGAATPGAPVLLRRHAGAGEAAVDRAEVGAALGQRGQGAMLPAALRQDMEARFKVPLHRVGVHTNATAAAAAAAVCSNAFTCGDDIFFAASTYDPAGHAGRQLLAHELAHVVQGRQGRVAAGASPRVSRPDEPLEREAESVAARVVSGGEAGLGPAASTSSSSSGALMRDAAPRDGLDASMVQVVSFVRPPPLPTRILKPGHTYKNILGGDETVGDGNISISSGGFTLTAAAALVDGVVLSDKPEPRIDVGFIQTVVSSTRSAVYKKGGAVVAERIQGGPTAPTRDARGDRDFKPFYSGSQALNNTSPVVEISLGDQPRFESPVEFAGGKIAETRGKDVFNTAVGFKRGDTIVKLHPIEWSVDWDASLDGAQDFEKDAKGADQNHGFTSRDLKEGQGTFITTGRNAVEVANDTPDLDVFHTVEAAKTQSGSTLLRALLPARAHDPATAANIVEALRQKTVLFDVTLKSVKKANMVFADKVDCWAQCHKTSATHRRELGSGDSVTIQVGLWEVLDPDKLTRGEKLKIWAGAEGHLGGDIELPYPFVGTAQIDSSSGSAGVYRVSVAISG